MTAYLIVDTKINDEEAYEEYKIRAKPIVEGTGENISFVAGMLLYQRMNFDSNSTCSCQISIQRSS